MSTRHPGEGQDYDLVIDREWQQASREEPPPHVDAAILSAARARRSRFSGWQPLTAAAAVAGLAFLLVQLMPVERGLERPTSKELAPPVPSSAEATSTGGAAPEAVAPLRAKAESGSAVPMEAEAPSRAVAPSQVDAPPEAVAQSSVPPPAPPVLKESVADADLQVAPPPPPMNEARVSGRAEADASMSAQQWAARIESLYRSGDIAAAEAELRRLRLAHPGAEQQLPDALRAWAASVQ